MRNDEEREIIEILKEALKDKDSAVHTMKVVGRGTLVMSARAARQSKRYKELVEKGKELIKPRREKK